MWPASCWVGATPWPWCAIRGFQNASTSAWSLAEHSPAAYIGQPPGLAEQLLPLLVREPLVVPIGARILATVIEESDVVVSLLERLDLAFDELIEFYEVVGQVLGNVEVHERERTVRPVGDYQRGRRQG